MKIKLYEEFINEYTEAQTQAYLLKKEKDLPTEADVKSVHDLIDDLNTSLGDGRMSFVYSLPYRDAPDKRKEDKHSAIAGQWWAGVTVMIDDNGRGQIGQVKFVKEPGQKWKFYNVKLHRDWRGGAEDKKIHDYLSK